MQIVPDDHGDGAAQVLASGVWARAVVVRCRPLGMRTESGVDFHGLVLTVICDGQPPFEAKVGLPVPDGAMSLLHPGANLPAKVIPGSTDDVAVDWDAAIVEATQIS